MKIATGIMLALVLFSSSLALLMYSKQNQLSDLVQEQVNVYVSTKDLHKGNKIKASDISMSKLPKSYLAFTPLTKEEIIGRYASVEIFTNEPFRSEKLSLRKPEKEFMNVTNKTKMAEDSASKVILKETISIPLSVFKNLDYSLKVDEFIDIVTVIPKKSKKNEYSFSTKYIALHVPIRSFVSKTKEINQMKSEIYNNSSKKTDLFLADTVVLEMSPQEIGNFLPIYYKTQELNAQRVHTNKEKRGHMWMVRYSNKIDAKIQGKKREMMIDKKRAIQRKAHFVERVSISYED